MFKKSLFVSAAILAAWLLPISKGMSVGVGAEISNTSVAPVEVRKLDKNFLITKLNNKLGLDVVKVEPTPIAGIALVIANQGLFYASYDGEFFIQGKVYDISSEVTDLAEQSLANMRLDGMRKFEKDMIVYPAKNEKHVVTIFTDITCGYCRKLHKQMTDYNDRGITIRYLAYPRSGIKDRSGSYTQGFKDLRSVWCNADPADALTRAKEDSGIPYRVCDKPVEAQFNFGRQVGVSGTPAIVLANGMMVPGYQPPEQLARLLESL